MNIFVLHKEPPICAMYHCDKHVVKMILETTQMLCTVANELGHDTPYKSVHKKHPCTLWAGTSLSNWLWLHELGLWLHNEYLWRYDPKKPHKCYDILQSLEGDIPDIPDIGLTPFAQAIPDEYKDKNVVKAYRNYYMHEKSSFATWTNADVPWWYKNKGGKNE